MFIFDKLMLTYLLCVVVLFLPEGLCDDATVLEELKKCASSSWCPGSDPCSSNCVTCDDNDKIIYIGGWDKGLTCLPDSIGSLTALTSLIAIAKNLLRNNNNCIHMIETLVGIH